MAPDKQSFSRERHSDIYIGGFSGARPAVPVDYTELCKRAQHKLSKKAFAYLDGGTGRESTISKNRRGFDRLKIVPRMLRDVSELDTSISLFGHQFPVPFLLAPIGVFDLFHKNADKKVTQATASQGVPMVISSQDSVPMERCADVMANAPRWFQLYWSTSNDLVKKFRKARRTMWLQGDCTYAGYHHAWMANP